MFCYLSAAVTTVNTNAHAHTDIEATRPTKNYRKQLFLNKFSRLSLYRESESNFACSCSYNSMFVLFDSFDDIYLTMETFVFFLSFLDCGLMNA